VFVALEFHHRSGNPVPPRRIGLFQGAYNPPTIAHLAMARAARGWADEVVWILPRAFPHKDFAGLDFAARLEMLRLVTAAEPGFSVAVADGGLYLEMAEEAREHFGPEPEIGLVCGRDAAERIAAWDYGKPGVFEAMIERFPLLVAARAGEYLSAPEHAGRIISLPMASGFDEVSSSEIRRRMAGGEPWRHLVPEPVAGLLP
jgi:nicotinate-nucleotide adenylyltransferase